jgi:hypothetical protein
MVIMKSVNSAPRAMTETAITIRVMSHLPIMEGLDISLRVLAVALKARKDLKTPSD